MVVADTSLFRSAQNFKHRAAHGVVVALMASEGKAACAENPRVLGPEGERESGPIPPQRDMQHKFNLGSCLHGQDDIRVLTMLENNVDRSAFSMEDIEPFGGEPMQLDLNSDKPIFRPPHKLGQVEWDFVEGQCDKLERLGFIRRSKQSKYASATVVVRKKDVEGNYIDFRQCGDYHPFNMETTLDRYPLPGIEEIFNKMGGATVFSKLDLRSGYHQMPLREEDWCKRAFWGQIVSSGNGWWSLSVLKMRPPTSSAGWTKRFAAFPSSAATLTISSSGPTRSRSICNIFQRLREAGLKVHPGKCV